MLRLLTDTREQRPLEFTKNALVTEVETVTLPFADYSAEWIGGARFPVVWERKTLGDLFSTMTSGYDRFKRELLMAQAAGVQMVLGIEATWTRIGRGYEYSQVSGLSMQRKLMTLWLRRNLRFVCCTNAAELASIVQMSFEALATNFRRVGVEPGGTVDVVAKQFGGTVFANDPLSPTESTDD
jgi:ERCC4-type nuclease